MSLFTRSHIHLYRKLPLPKRLSLARSQHFLTDDLSLLEQLSVICRVVKFFFSMEGVGADAASAAAPLNQWRHDAWKVFQFYLDKTTPHAVNRWVGTFFLASLYALRVYYIQGFYIVTYGLGIYILNLLIGFLSPLVDPEMEPSDGPLLPTKGSDEFKPFIRRLPEFKFWYAITKAFCVGFVMTFFSMFDVPVFWPILLCYWVVLFVLTMKRQIMHMIKYKYVPLNVGKQKYGGKRTSASGSSSRAD